MSVRVMTWAFDRAPTTNPTDQLVLIAIADRCNDDGLEAWPSIQTLARKTRLSERAVWGALQRLKSLGILAIRQGSGRRRSNHYEILMPPRTTCDLAPRATSQAIQAEHARPATTPCTTCDPDPAPRANDPSSTSTTSHTSARVDDLRNAWNELTTPPIARAREMNDNRSRAAAARLQDPGIETMREVFNRINGSAFCRGESGGNWRATFDWALKPTTITKVLEGNYDGAVARRPAGRTGAPKAGKYAGMSAEASDLERAS